jgi:hypothetical protein
MTVLPEPPATMTGQATNPLTDAVIKAAIDNALHEARRLDTSPPALKPERPPMSQRAVDASAVMLSASAATIPPGAIAIGVMLASGYANPTVIGMVCAAPAIVAVPILAVARLVRRAGEAAPTEIHQTYTGNVHQETRITHTRAVWAKTINRD